MSIFPNHDLESELDPTNPEFVDNFNKMIEESNQRWKNKIKSNPNYLNEEESGDPNALIKKKKKVPQDIFKDPAPFKPANFYGSEFEKLKILKHGKVTTDWDLARVHLIERSYFKGTDKIKDIQYNGIHGREFGEKDLPLTRYGSKVLSKFINDNEKRVQSARRLDEDIDKYRHSKPPIVCNPWKYSSQLGNAFSTPAADKFHKFNKSPKNTKGNKKPFLRTKIDGDYFNNIDLSCEFDKYSIKI